jgi:hypothetical protein
MLVRDHPPRGRSVCLPLTDRLLADANSAPTPAARVHVAAYSLMLWAFHRIYGFRVHKVFGMGLGKVCGGS